MTPQEAFNINWNHFVVNKSPLGMIREGGKLNAPNFRCRYRTPDGCCCGIGVLFPPDIQLVLQEVDCPVGELGCRLRDELNDGRLNGEQYNVANRILSGLKEPGKHPFSCFMEDLQSAHDGARPQDDPEVPACSSTRIDNRLSQLAIDYNLTIPETHVA